MLNRILYAVNASSESVHGARFVAELALASGAQIIALNVIDTSVAKYLKTATGASESETAIKLQEDGWRYLYDVEDVCKSMGAKIVLHQQEGLPEAIIAINARRFKAELVVAPHSRAGGCTQSRSERFVIELVERLECPVLVV